MTELIIDPCGPLWGWVTVVDNESGEVLFESVELVEDIDYNKVARVTYSNSFTQLCFD